jgi:hypothetical protein
MTPEALFQAANPLALLGWLALCLAPVFPRIAMPVAGLVIPLVLSAGYTSVMLAHWTSAPGGFDSLPAVAQLMENRWLLLAGWAHYLAFDLVVGTWEVRTARREGIPHLLVLPCLALTFLFGPAGYLTFQALRASRPRLRDTAARYSRDPQTQMQDMSVERGNP